MAPLPNIVLVHGAWADGSCWSAVVERLQADGHHVVAPQLPETSLADDGARVRQVLGRLSGPTVLAGHSYGGQVITSLGTDAPNVVGLKDATGNVLRCQDLKRRLGDRLDILCGDDSLTLPMMAVGASGVIADRIAAWYASTELSEPASATSGVAPDLNAALRGTYGARG